MKIEILLILIIVNLASFVIVAIDKYKAIKHKWRIPEKNIFLLAAFGGSVGVYAGMFVFSHKTKHWKFMIGVPVILAMQVLLAWKVTKITLLIVNLSSLKL